MTLLFTAHAEQASLPLAWLWLLNGLEWNWLASPLKVSGVDRYSLSKSDDWHSPLVFHLDSTGQIMLMKFVRHRRVQHTHTNLHDVFNIDLINIIIITVFHLCVSGCGLRDSATKAARTKCQRILGKQSKAFELMQRGTEGNPHPNLPASIHSLLRVHLLPLVGASFSRFYSFPFPVSGSQSKTNKPLLQWHKSRSSNLWRSEPFSLPTSPLFFIFVVDIVRHVVIP